MHIRKLTTKGNDLLITCIVEPKLIPVTFLVDTGAQISAIKTEDADSAGVTLSRKKIFVADAMGGVHSQTMATVRLRIPGEEVAQEISMVVGKYPLNLLGLDVLKGRSWIDDQGGSWVFGAPTLDIRLLQVAPPLPPSHLTTVKPYPLPLGARSGISPVLAELKEQGIVIPTHSPFNSPVWPVRKPNGKWRLTIDYRRLNANTAPLTAAVPNLSELIAAIQEQAHPIMASIDVKDMFFMVPLHPDDQLRFAFTWEGQQYTFTRLPQGYKHSPTLAHHALAQELEQIPLEEGVKIYQYIDDILIGGDQLTAVKTTHDRIINHLEGLGLTIPPDKIQSPAAEVKFLGIWWKGGMACIPQDTLSALDKLKMPENKKELQHALGLLVFWRKHIPDFSIIARPLYDLLRKGVSWEWTPVHEEALQLLIFEAVTHQALGPIHPSDPVQIEWGFAQSGLTIHLWQKGPEGPIRPIGFFSRSFKDAEKRYSQLEKGLFVVSLALREAERTIRQQPIILRGPFKVIKSVMSGTPPPDGVAQRASVRKWYAQIEHYCNTFTVSEGAPKILPIQDNTPSTTDADLPPVIQVAPPFSNQVQNAWFTDASAKREGKVWKYRAVALQIGTNFTIVTEGEGSAQVGELVAVWSVFQHESQSTVRVHIYTDSYAVFKGCTEWLPFWEQNGWEVNRIPIWQKDKWQEILAIAKQGQFSVAWVASHQEDGTPASQWNNKADELARIAPLRQGEPDSDNWERLLEWLHLKRGHTGTLDLYREAQARGWPVTREQCRTCISACDLCCTRLDRHPLQDAPLHLREGKHMWETWQIDYIGPFRRSENKQYVLVGVEVVSGLLQAESFPRATGENTIKALKKWFSILPKPNSIQSDNGSHFTSGIVQEWAREEGIHWIFHTPYYPQANGIVERSNGLLKKFLKPEKPNWSSRTSDAVRRVNDRWGINGCPRFNAFCPKAPPLLPITLDPDANKLEEPSYFPGQPVLADLPNIGPVPLTLMESLNRYTWKAKDAREKEYKINTRWIIPSF